MTQPDKLMSTERAEKLKRWIDMASSDADKGLRMVLVDNYKHPVFQCEEALRRREAFEQDNPGEFFNDKAQFQKALDDWAILNNRLN